MGCENILNLWQYFMIVSVGSFRHHSLCRSGMGLKSQIIKFGCLVPGVAQTIRSMLIADLPITVQFSLLIAYLGHSLLPFDLWTTATNGSHALTCTNLKGIFYIHQQLVIDNSASWWNLTKIFSCSTYWYFFMKSQHFCVISQILFCEITKLLWNKEK